MISGTVILPGRQHWPLAVSSFLMFLCSQLPDQPPTTGYTSHHHNTLPQINQDRTEQDEIIGVSGGLSQLRRKWTELPKVSRAEFEREKAEKKESFFFDC